LPIDKAHLYHHRQGLENLLTIPYFQYLSSIILMLVLR
jgi:hypothetical protein